MEKLKIGEHFFYRNDDYLDDIEFILLDIINGNYFSIMADLLPERMPFDTAGTNKWETSSLRAYLNKVIYRRLGGFLHLVPHNGDDVTLLSIEEYEKYKHLIPKRNISWWTRSPHLSDATNAWLVYPAGSVTTRNGTSALGVSHACEFSSTNLTIRPQGDTKIVFYDS